MGHDDTDRKSRPDRQRWSHVELPPDDLLTGIVDRVLTAIPDRLDETVVIVGGELGADRLTRSVMGHSGAMALDG